MQRRVWVCVGEAHAEPVNQRAVRFGSGASVRRPDAVAAKLALELAELGVLSGLASDPTARTRWCARTSPRHGDVAFGAKSENQAGSIPS
jgi:hypothetical protein